MDTRPDYSLDENVLSRSKAIRQKCLDCCCWQMSEVRLCTATKCPLWPYRMGTLSKNPAKLDDFSEAE